ncbi:SAM-dependent methyltransferase [Sulfitobacter sp. JL08]|uniref:RsmB/NOP family class I SAM-dependent RNA methyltransferase n=1 Tax=Sulfitobacter sp. JL08 TaxID=2070369 RepID=UPI000E0AE7AC|nr:RsmB/NOP family class I SAM-dependent RNA methyltransferase [Sulfitobacter sp. JL08]AXI54873.1 SAM-dependent methyltransferase [Sulfitobacter sp. JL08]
MTPSARVAAAVTILDEILNGVPAEQALTSWARRSRFAGSKDRAAIRDHVFDAIRRKLSFAALGGGMSGRGLMIGQVRASGADPETVFTGDGYGAPALDDAERAAGQEPQSDSERWNLPDWLVRSFKESLGDAAEDTAMHLAERAPVMLRVNLAMGSVAEAIDRLAEEGISVQPHGLAETVLVVCDGARKIRNSAAYTSGCVELQDAASQAVVAALPLRDDQTVLDYCAGGGGKTLAMAARVNARFFAYDIDPGRMKDLPLRAVRAGAGVRMLTVDELAQNGPYDLVLCDAPCSGSGAWRRSPDGKWTLTPEKLNDLNGVQDDVLSNAAALVAPNGTLAYATCSVLRSENQDRVQAFLSRNPEWKCTFEQVFLPSQGGDGFYSAHLTRG